MNWRIRTDDDDERARALTFILVGGAHRRGAGGVHGANGDAHSARAVPTDRRREKRRSFWSKAARVFFRHFPKALARKAARRLEKLGVKIMTGVKVEQVDENGVIANGKEFRAQP